MYSRIAHQGEALPGLKIVVKYGVGVDNIDIPAARSLGIAVANVPNYCVQEVALQSLALGLSGLRRVPLFAQQTKAGVWIGDPSKEALSRPSSVCLGLIGFGRIARQLASYAAPMVSRTIFFDPHVPPAAERVDDLGRLFELSQLVSIHAPVNPETTGMVDGAALQRGKSVVLVNTSRAAIVDRRALEAALDSGGVCFYGADTFWQEPPDYTDPWTASFLKREAVTITPHMGWYSTESDRELRRKAAEEIARAIRGDRPRNPV